MLRFVVWLWLKLLSKEGRSSQCGCCEWRVDMDKKESCEVVTKMCAGERQV